MKYFLFIITLLQGFLTDVLAQEGQLSDFQKQFQIGLTKTNEPIKIDGIFDEKVWSEAKATSPFWKKYPNDDGRPARSTEVKIAYDDHFIYFAFTAYDSGKLLAQGLKRDLGHDGSDGIAIVLDPINQHTNGFFFVVSALNAQSDDQLTPYSQINWSWDNKWYSATKIYADRWTVEIAIPFKSIRYRADKLLWGINFLRVDTKSNEYSTWTHVPVNFPSYDLGHTGLLTWKESPPSGTSNISFIPYVTSSLIQNKENNEASKLQAKGGFDSKIGISSSLNLDLTVNPDFSQVEVDQQVTNLTRFNIFFPEKRTFFLDNADLFSEYGNPTIRPFYSRTIGLNSNGEAIPIIAGLRLNGNITKTTRIGIMDVQTARKGSYNPENYSANTISQKVLKRSAIKAYFFNRQAFMSDSLKKIRPLDAYGRNAGIEFDYTNLPGTWNAWATYNQSFKPGVTDKDAYTDFGGNYIGRHLNVVLEEWQVGTNYYTDMGYVQRIENYDALRDTVVRVGFKSIYNIIQYKFFPKNKKINALVISLLNNAYLNPDNSLNERIGNLGFSLQYQNTSMINLNLNNDDLNLLYPISFTGAQPLPAAHYGYTQVSADYESDFRKNFSYSIKAGKGGFYNGDYTSVGGSVYLRKQPHLNLSIQGEFDKLSFPSPYGATELFLVAPKVEINFSTRLFWTTFIQYNTQKNNFNINSRFQYRFKPMSDIYLVYTDNYFSNPLLKGKNRAVVFKMNYWLNL